MVPAPRGALVRAAHPLVELGGPTMGTTWSLKASGAAASAARVRVVVQNALDEVVAQMSQWETGSALTRFNVAPAGARHVLPADLAAVLGCALEIAADTGGAFDPTLGPVTELWGFGAAAWSGGPPDPERLAQARVAVGWRRLDLDKDRGLVQPGGLRLDLCGIAKGFAVDKVAQALRALGVAAFLIEVGGELSGHGLRPDGQPWWAALEPPRPGLRYDVRIALPGWAVATSGDYRRGFDAPDRRYSHTFDPAAGAPLPSTGERVISASVLDPSCMRADALATALTVMGPHGGLAYADRRGVPALLIVEGPNGVDLRPSRAWSQLEA